jgi:molybdopterin synthase catalytic subunit
VSDLSASSAAADGATVTVRLFATLRQRAGWKERAVRLHGGATVRDLIAHLDATNEGLNLAGRTIYVAINEEYVKGDATLGEGDMVGIFPPVSGGAQAAGGGEMKFFEITEAPLSVDEATRRVSRADCGAVATFAGIVRGETATATGQRDTDFLHYEAYTAMAERKMAQIGDEIRAQWPKVQAVCILHRLGRLEIGEPSVVIAVATPHRGDGCFDACAYAIERLKAIVPIWKQENWADGEQWIEGPRQPELEV